jgi:beta-glucosidase-like glycosyl hydrolase
MGSEFKAKGAHVILGPVSGPLGRVALGGRNWEGFSPDPYLTGVGMSQTISGLQSVGLQSCAKHFILNEQETQRNPSFPNGTTLMPLGPTSSRSVRTPMIEQYTSSTCGHSPMRSKQACPV